MSFLIAEIVLCLLAAALIGLLLGWWLRHLSAKSEVESLSSDWRKRVKASELQLAEAAEQYTTLESKHGIVSADLESARSRQLELTTETQRLSTNVSSLMGNVKQKEETLASVQAERDEFVAQLDGSQAELEQARAAISKVRDDSAARISGLEQELAEARERSAQTSKQLEASDSKVSVLSHELEASREKADSIQTALDASATRVSTFQADFDSLGQKIATLESELSESRSTVESSRRAFEQLRLDKDKQIAEFQSLVDDRENHDTFDRQALVDAEALVSSLQADRRSTDELLGTLEQQLSIRDEDLNALRSELTSSERAISSLESAINQARQHSSEVEQALELRDEELVELKTQLERRGEALRASEAQAQALHAELDNLSNRSHALADEQIALRGVVEERDRTIDALNKDLSSQVGSDAKLRAQLEESTTQVSFLEGELRKLRSRLGSLETDIEQRRHTIVKLDDEVTIARKRHASYEATVHDLTIRNTELEDLLEEARARGAASSMISVDKQSGRDEMIRPSWILDSPSRGHKDDLKLVKGIGPVLEGMLNKLGVYYFEQVANFTTSDVEWVSEQLDSFPDRVYRDKWIQQAALLQRRKQGEVV